MNPYFFTSAKQPAVPILLSVPHCGTAFPDDIKDQYHHELIAQPDDTDWYVNQLYAFAAEMGISMISAKYSRWVIDLNRDPESKPLYNDGRIITGLCPTTDFHGNAIYVQNPPDAAEIKRRVKEYYIPYHQKIQQQLTELKSKFGHVLLWDAHSIRHYVPTIHKEKFPDLILGSADETSAHPQLIQTSLQELSQSNYDFRHNYPFKGGQITRHFGKPQEHQHALQLEMSKLLYMDDAEITFDEGRAEKVRIVLKATFEKLLAVLPTLSA